MFISIEGSEGCGKTTQAALLSKFIQQQGYPVLSLREPGGTPIGDQIRSILLGMHNTSMSKRTEVLLFQASRAQLVEQVICPHLEAGEVVLCDRYADSTLAYQGYGYGLDLDVLRAMIGFATDGLKPDLTLLLDVDVEVGLQRRTQGGSVNRMDVFEKEFYQRVRTGFLEMARAEPKRWVVIDAAQPFLDVQSAMQRAVIARLAPAR